LPFHTRIYNDERVLSRANAVYLYLSDHQGTKEATWPGINTMARELTMSRNTVIRAVADLERLGYIIKESAFRPNKAQTANRYRVIR
jgi:DNA-binding transcriptional regulator YhcF (GntR family)